MKIIGEWRVVFGRPRYQVLRRSVEAWMEAHPGEPEPDAKTVYEWMKGEQP